MKTDEEWAKELSELGFNHPADCICDRCKKGRETFLLTSDIKDIQLDAWKQGMTDAGEFVWNQGGKSTEWQMNDLALKIYKLRDNKKDL